MLPTEASALEDDELDLRAYLHVLRRRWKAIALVVILVVGTALGLSLRETPMYRASSVLLIRQSDSSQLVAGTPIGNVYDAARRLNNDVLLFRSDAVLLAVAERYDGPLNPGRVRASVSSDTSDVMAASITAADPAEAAKLLNLYVETFIEVRRQQSTDEVLAVATEIQTNMDEVEAEIAKIRPPLDALEARVAADPGNSQLVAQRDAMAKELAPQLGPLESRKAAYQRQIDALGVVANVTGTNSAQVLARAYPPSNPVSPTPERDAALALVLGLMLGVGAAFLLDTLDERLRTVTDLERVSGGLPTLALIPEVEKGHDAAFVAARDDPRSPQAEAFRSLRTSVKFATLDRPLKVIQVTSSAAGEGKTTTVANLAVALAQGGDRVAVVCCDLRRPKVQDRFGMRLIPGLTDVLLGDAALSDALQPYDDNMFLLAAGTPPPNPSELLSSHKAAAVIRALAEEFDVVILDSPPVLPVTDAMVISHLVDATLVVANSRSTSRKAVHRTLQQLAQVHAPVIGLVLNGLPAGGAYGYGYGYGYTYDSEPKSRRQRKRLATVQAGSADSPR